MLSPETSPNLAQEEALFHAARSLADPAARSAFLGLVCRDQPELRERLEGLLAAGAEGDELFGVADSGERLIRELAVGGRLGDYELLQEIGRGGMGRVYRARQLSTQRIVALKVLGGGSAAASDQVRRFENEVAAAAGLHHPNIVPIFEFGSCGGVRFFSMELINGRPLSELNEAAGSASILGHSGAGATRPFLNPKFQLPEFCQIVRAVAFAHERGVLHRDLKPGNVLVDEAGKPYLIDFGLAKLLQTDLTLTRTADVMGTPSHMAPEQACGRNSSPATDVYGLGAILYESITGRPPFRAESPVETLRQVIETTPVHPTEYNPTVDPVLALICLRCLEKDPRHRYASAAALADDLERWGRNDPISAKPIGLLEKGRRWTQRNPLAAAFILTLVIGLGSTLGLLLRVNQEKNKQAALASELRSVNQESTRLLARAVGMVKENLDSLWENSDRRSMLVGSDEIAAIANRPVVALSGKGQPLRYTLGLMAEESPTDRAQRYADLLAYVEDRLGKAMGRPVKVDVRFYKYLVDCRTDLCSGKVDFVRCGALPLLLAQRQVPGLQPLVVPIGDPKQGVLFTRAGSEIRSIEDLRGRRVAFGETNSTVSFRAQIELARRGIGAAQLAGYDCLDASLEFSEEVREIGFEEAVRRIGYLHSHAEVIEGVLSGRYDAGVAAFRAFQINHSRGLAAIADSEFVSSRGVWVARAGLDAALAQSLQQALTSLQGEPWMALLPDHPSGFERWTPQSFALEASWLDRIGVKFPAKPSPRVAAGAGGGKTERQP